MVTGVSPEQYRKMDEFGLFEQSRHRAAFGNAPGTHGMTINGKESMGEPSLGIQTRKGLTYMPTTNCIPSNRPVSDGEEETLARQV